MGYRDRMRERVGAFRRWRRALPRVVAMMAGGVLLVAGCTGDDGSSVAVTDESVVAMEATTTVAPTTTVPVTTTTAAPTAIPSTTTIATTTTTSTTVPESSLDDLEAEIAAAYEERFDGYWECLRAPAECRFGYLLPGSPSDEGMRRTIAELMARDRFVGDENVGYFVIQSVDIADSETEATVVSCWWSTAVLYTTPADPSRPMGPDNPPTIVNNTPGSTFLRDDFAFAETKGWLLQASASLEQFPEENRCAG